MSARAERKCGELLSEIEPQPGKRIDLEPCGGAPTRSQAAEVAQQPVPIGVAAGRLGVDVETVRKWLRAGAPQARRGRRGRGRKALLDVDAVRAWRAVRNGAGGEANTAALELIAAEVPDILSAALWEAFTFVESTTLSRRTLAGVFLLAFTKAATDIRARIARDAPNVVPELIGEPQEISKVARYLKPVE